MMTLKYFVCMLIEYKLTSFLYTSNIQFIEYKRKETRFHSGILFLFRTDCYFPIFSTFGQHIFSSVFATSSKSAFRLNFKLSSENDQALQIEKSFRSLCRTTISLTPNHTFGKKSCHFLKHLNKHKNSFHFYLYRD